MSQASTHESMSTQLFIEAMPAEDLAWLRHNDWDAGPHNPFVKLGAGGLVSFTVRGIRFYSRAVKAYRLDIELHTVRHELDLLHLNYMVSSGIADDSAELLERQLKRNPNSQEAAFQSAILYGSRQDVLLEAAKLRKCREAGCNVIPLKTTQAGL